MCVLNFIWPEEDLCFVEAALDATHNCEFIISEKSYYPSVRSSFEYLEKFVSQVKSPYLTKEHSIAIWAESEEAANTIVNRNTGEVLSKYHDSVKLIHLTDQGVYNKHPLVMKVHLKIKYEAKQLEENSRVLNAVFNLIDHLENISFGKGAVDKQKSNRTEQIKQQKQESQEKMAEEAQKRRDDKDKLEKERVKKLSPEELKKYQDRQKKKQLKDQMRKGFKVVKR